MKEAFQCLIEWIVTIKYWNLWASFCAHWDTINCSCKYICSRKRSRNIFASFCKGTFLLKWKVWYCENYRTFESLKSSHTRLLVALVNIIFKFVKRINIKLSTQRGEATKIGRWYSYLVNWNREFFSERLEIQHFQDGGGGGGAKPPTYCFAKFFPKTAWK